MVSKADWLFADRLARGNSIKRCMLCCCTVFIGFLLYSRAYKSRGRQGEHLTSALKPPNFFILDRRAAFSLQVMLFLLSFAVGPTAALWDYFKGGLSPGIWDQPKPGDMVPST